MYINLMPELAIIADKFYEDIYNSQEIELLADCSHFEWVNLMSAIGSPISELIHSYAAAVYLKEEELILDINADAVKKFSSLIYYNFMIVLAFYIGSESRSYLSSLFERTNAKFDRESKKDLN